MFTILRHCFAAGRNKVHRRFHRLRNTATEPWYEAYFSKRSSLYDRRKSATGTSGAYYQPPDPTADHRRSQPVG
jgi:hypothetical protein